MLGVDRAASEDDVRAAFRRLSRQTHPDAGGTGGLYRLLVDARDAMLAGAGSARIDSPAGQDASPRPPPTPTRPPQPPPSRDEWVVDDEDPYTSRRYEAPPQSPPRQAPADDVVDHGAATAARQGGFLAALARIPTPHTAKGWGRLTLLWIVLNTVVGHTVHHDVLGVLAILVIGWSPILLIAAALARRWVRRSRWFR